MKQKYFIGLISFLLLFSACQKKSNISDPTDNGQRIVILYTNDEHGWMQSTDTYNGAAGLMGLWQEQEGYTVTSESMKKRRRIARR